MAFVAVVFCNLYVLFGIQNDGFGDANSTPTPIWNLARASTLLAGALLVTWIGIR
jgi:hypothetical protein